MEETKIIQRVQIFSILPQVNDDYIWVLVVVNTNWVFISSRIYIRNECVFEIYEFLRCVVRKGP